MDRRTCLWFIVLFCFLLQNQLNQCSSLRVKGFSLLEFRERIQRDLCRALSNRNDIEHDPSFLRRVRHFPVNYNVFIQRAYYGRADFNMLARRHLQANESLGSPGSGSKEGKNVPRDNGNPGATVPSNETKTNASAPAPAPAPAPTANNTLPPLPANIPAPSANKTPPAVAVTPPPSFQKSPRSSLQKKKVIYIIVAAIAACSFILLSGFGFIFYRSKSKKTTVKPAVVGLSGQLKKAISMGVSMLERSELQRCCEDFCNIVGVSSEYTVYKGTLSTGVEIAVASSTAKDESTWSDYKESKFTEKILTLGRVKHKNFLALLGYCVEDQPFTRMTVLEYASNGTLFNLLHDEDTDQIEWPTRMRIVMGIAYCLEHLHQMNPPIVYKDLRADHIYLTDDYAAKIADFGFGSESIAQVSDQDVLQFELKKNVYDFGEILLEIMTGKKRYSQQNGLLTDWARDHLSDPNFQKSMLDSTLSSYKEDQVSKLCEIIQTCIDPDVSKIPAMRDIVARLAEVLHVSPQEATPKLSPLWWAEVEILSS